ncbi:hypothetical protein KI387_003495, partial [Taxus chinensis]
HLESSVNLIFLSLNLNISPKGQVKAFKKIQALLRMNLRKHLLLTVFPARNIFEAKNWETHLKHWRPLVNGMAISKVLYVVFRPEMDLVLTMVLVQAKVVLHQNEESTKPHGNDVGTQYRSGIYYYSPEQERSARESMERHQETVTANIVTEILPAKKFYRAEEYHQQYLEKGGRSRSKQSAAKGCTDPIRCYG